MGGGEDGPFTTSEKPIYIKENQINLMKNIIDGNIQTKMPFVYVSCLDNGYSCIDEDNLSKWLSGIAHVIIEPSRNFSRRLSNEIRGNTCYNGAISIYWPESNGKFIKILPWNYTGKYAIEFVIQEIIRDALIRSKKLNKYNWFDIKEIIQNIKLKKIKENDINLENTYKDYISLIEEQNNDYKKELEDLKTENINLKEENLSLRRLKHDTSIKILELGEEKEFYNGEFKDVIIESLKHLQTRCFEQSRIKHIIDDLLNINKKSECQKYFEEKIKKIFKNNKISNTELKELEKIGFTYSVDNKHYKIKYNDDNRYMITITKTPSDHRTGKNTASKIIRMLKI